MIAVVVAALAITLPVFSFAPRLYGWFVQQKLRKLYRRLRIVGKALQMKPAAPEAKALENEIREIDEAADGIGSQGQRRHAERWNASCRHRAGPGTTGAVTMGVALRERDAAYRARVFH